MKFDHIGVTTSSLEVGQALLEQAVGVRIWTQPFEDLVNDVWVQFGEDTSGTCYELVAPLSGRSPIRHALSKKINVLNHVAYLVDNIGYQANILAGAGFAPVAPPRPAIAYGNKPIQFFVSRTRLLIELIEAPDHQHSYLSRLGRS
jgi:methylmalonyl-CoA/ethylmalonyl-CoA epimerase